MHMILTITVVNDSMSDRRHFDCLRNVSTDAATEELAVLERWVEVQLVLAAVFVRD